MLYGWDASRVNVHIPVKTLAVVMFLERKCRDGVEDGLQGLYLFFLNFTLW